MAKDNQSVPEAEEPSQRPAVLPANSIENATDGSILVLIPAGKFLLGEDKFTLDLPAYYLGLTEVTRAQYKRFIDSTGHRAPRTWQDRQFAAGKGEHPVVDVTWEDATAYCRWAGLRLPTVCRNGKRESARHRQPNLPLGQSVGPG